MEPIAKAIALKAELDNLRPLSKEQEAIIMQKFRLDWNYNSNNLEGNSLTYGETKALLLHGITAQGKPLKDHFEITGHDEAIKWVEDLVKEDHPLTENFIRELHTLLLKSPYEVKAITPDGQPTTRRIAVGQYKTAPNHVKTKTVEIFRFATPEETPAKMHDLIQWYREKSEEPDVNPILLAAEFHYRFIRIHPFDDGNGRTARILMNFILMKFGYPPAIIKTEDKDNYFFALQQADAGTIEPFINYIATNLVRSLEIMIAGAKGESIEEPDDITKEFILLKNLLKEETPSVSPQITYDTFDYFNNTIKNYLDKTLDSIEDLFDNKQEEIYVNGKKLGVPKINLDSLKSMSGHLIKPPNPKIYGHDVYDGIESVKWNFINYGLRGSIKAVPLIISYSLSFSTKTYTIKYFVNNKLEYQTHFPYHHKLNPTSLDELDLQFKKIITQGLKAHTGK